MARTLPSWAQGLAPIATPAPITSWSSPKIATPTTGYARWRRSPARRACTRPRRSCNIVNCIKEVEATRDAWSKAGHAMGDLQATAFARGCVLKDGEPADSERAMAQAGPRAAVMLHRAADEALAGLAPGVTMVSRTRPEMQGYVNLARDFEKDAPYLQNHRGHLMYVKPEEKRFVSAELISATSFTASEAEIKQRIDALCG